MPEGGSIALTEENVTLRGTETIEGIKGEFVALAHWKLFLPPPRVVRP
jgi:hypothetical protein